VKFDYDDEQRLLADSVQRLLAHEYDFEARRKIVASEHGFSAAAWKSFADLGLLGLGLPPDYGGFGGGARACMSVMEAFGDALVVEPYLATVMTAQFIARGGTPAQKESILREVADGTRKLAFAQTEMGARYNLAQISTRAQASNDGYMIDGHKTTVMHGPCADLLVVSARTAGDGADSAGISLFLVDPRSSGVTLRSARTLDGLRMADVSFASVSVSTDALVGTKGAALPLIEEVVDYGTALLSAEAVGAIGYANAATLDYLKTRQQFGVPIGTFQALQHRMVDMTISHEQVKSMAGLACATVDGERDAAKRKRMVSAAKVKIAEAARHVSQESIQLHGGMGMSDELKISHTFRRLTMIAQLFGDANHHLERFTRL
jgi:alkylation response protein AidB-like acyl-CoA dehydrogenase